MYTGCICRENSRWLGNGSRGDKRIQAKIRKRHVLVWGLFGCVYVQCNLGCIPDRRKKDLIQFVFSVISTVSAPSGVHFFSFAYSWLCGISGTLNELKFHIKPKIAVREGMLLRWNEMLVVFYFCRLYMERLKRWWLVIGSLKMCSIWNFCGYNHHE